MLSPGKKVHWLCPNCNSPEIHQQRMYGQNSGMCHNQDCRTWWPWFMRQKVPVDQELPAVQKPRKTFKDKWRLFWSRWNEVIDCFG